MLNLKDMQYFSRDVGKGIKSTVHEYRWEFTIEETDVCIQLFIYLISNIRKVVYNHEVLKEEHGGPNNTYSYEFINDGHHYKIVQVDNLTQLFIDGASFDYNYTLERNKKEFEGNNNSKVCNIFNNDTDEIQPSNEIEFIKNEKQKQKLNLSIGIQKNSSLNKKPNNLNKFKFDSGENIKINKFNENQNNSKINEINDNNLIDFDNDFNNSNNNYNNNFVSNGKNNDFNTNNYNDLNNINFNSNNIINNNNNNYQNNFYNEENINNNNFINSNNYNRNNLNNQFGLNNDYQNNNKNNYTNNYNLEMHNNVNFNVDKNNNNYNINNNYNNAFRNNDNNINYNQNNTNLINKNAFKTVFLFFIY